MNITVIGGGNIGTQFACECAAKGYRTTVFSSKPDAYSGQLQIVNKTGSVVTTGTLFSVTDDWSVAIQDVDIVFVTHPAFMLVDTANKMLPYIHDGLKIGVIPGTGGAEFAFRKCIEQGAILFGLQRVPAVARLVEYGHSVCVEGKRDKLYLGCIPQQYSQEMADFMANLFDMPCGVLPNYLCVTMTPSNPILHTTRLCTLFKDYKPGVVYDKNPLFYGEWSDESSDLLLKCDEEHQQILKAIKGLDLTSVKSLKEHYENSTVSGLTRKMRSIESLHDLSSPMKEIEGGWIPDFESRYFTADFPYGLAIIQQFANIVGIRVSNIEKTLMWYKEQTNDVHKMNLSNYELNTIKDIYELYGQKVKRGGGNLSR